MAGIVSGAHLFVEPREREEYELSHGDRQRIVMLDRNDGGFPTLLNAMLARATSEEWPWFMFCDDDVRGFKWRPKGPADLNEVYRRAVIVGEERGYSQVMVSFAGHNWFYDGDVKERVGAWCAIVQRTEDLVEVGGYDEDLPIFTDWDMSARLLLAGKMTACWYEAMFVHKMKSMEGGAADIYRHPEVLTSAIERLRDRYGEKAVRVVEAHGQPEPRFRWDRLSGPDSVHVR